MIKEYELFFKKKYYIVILAVFLLALFFFVMNLTNGATSSYLDESLNSSFSNYIEKYSSFAELEDKINQYKTSPELVEDGKFKIELYTQLLNKKIPYDSCTSYIDTTLGSVNKHSPFHFYGTFSVIMCVFSILTSCILASISATNKTNELVDINGYTRNKAAFLKYLSSLTIFMSFNILVMSLVGLIGLIFKNNGLEYVYFVSGNKILLLNYAQFFFLQLSNLLLFTIVIYTLIYYFALGCKNRAISLVVTLSAFIVSLFVRLDFNRAIIILKQMSTYGILGFTGYDLCFNNLNEICYFLVYIGITIVAILFGLYRLNKTDCTR